MNLQNIHSPIFISIIQMRSIRHSHPLSCAKLLFFETYASFFSSFIENSTYFEQVQNKKVDEELCRGHPSFIRTRTLQIRECHFKVYTCDDSTILFQRKSNMIELIVSDDFISWEMQKSKLFIFCASCLTDNCII